MEQFSIEHNNKIVYDFCKQIYSCLEHNEENNARNQTIRLLNYIDLYGEHDYKSLVNHIIREVGLFPYMSDNNLLWDDKAVKQFFSVDVGEEKPVVLHRAQSLLLKKLIDNENILVSAPTSFGKSFVVDAFIKIKNPRNVMIIVPTIALTDETRRRIYRKFASEYNIITTTDAEIREKNIFIFPQERALAYIDKIQSLDILIIDEFYKSSIKFEKERASSLIHTIIKYSKIAKQKYYLAPNISNVPDNPFTKDMQFLKLDFNTVFLRKHDLYKDIGTDEGKKAGALLRLLKDNHKTLIYAATYTNIDTISKILISEISVSDQPLLNNFANWVGENYSSTWILTMLLKRGIGIHNGSIHRPLSQLEIRLFEIHKGLKRLISTSSIIEGVNTSAENVIIWQTRGRGRGASVNNFSYKNIIGRAARMFKYFIGNVYILQEPPEEEQIELPIPMPEKLLPGLDKINDRIFLTREQVAAIEKGNNEMKEVLGEETYSRLKELSIYQDENYFAMDKIAIDIKNDYNEWRTILESFLPYKATNSWRNGLFPLIRYCPDAHWHAAHAKIVAYIIEICDSWNKTIPTMLSNLDSEDIGIDLFFMLEKDVTFNLAPFLSDVCNIFNKIYPSNQINITAFVAKLSHAFLPKVVYQIEEYGLPRMISKKINNAGVINFEDPLLTLENAVEMFQNISKKKNIHEIKEMTPFDKFVINNFYEGIKKNE